MRDKYYPEEIQHPLGKEDPKCAYRINPLNGNKEVWNPCYDRWQFSCIQGTIEFSWDIDIPTIPYELTWAEYYNEDYDPN